MAAARGSKKKVGKRLIVACDGTWMNSDRAWQGASWLPSWIKGDSTSLETVPSNVTRICRTIAHHGKNGTPQIIYYSAGVGSEDTLYAHLFGGITGRGVDEHIREAYSFIQSNWTEEDEIVLLGFSRGAFTARSIAAFVSDVGILTRVGMNHFQDIFQDWECQLYDGYQPRWPNDMAHEQRPCFQDASYQAELSKRDMTRLGIPIKAIGVWDTVGALGIPDIGPFNFRKRLSFVNTEVSSSVEFAFQALALDEKRRPFLPTLWESPTGKNSLKVLQQCWFPGVHSNIGSGYDDTEIADLTLAWMITKLEKCKVLEFLPEAVIELRDLHVKRINDHSQGISKKRWGLGTLYNSMTLYYQIAGSQVRTPGRYCRTDPKSGGMTNERLSATNEYIHPSVRLRRDFGGRGVGDLSDYKPEALQGWHTVHPVSTPRRHYVWESEFRGDYVELPEDVLEGLELELLKCSPAIYDAYLKGSQQ